MKAGIFTTTIEKIVDMGLQQTRHFKLTFEPGTEFDFEAGQFISVILPREDGKTFKRAYSIDSPPCWKGYIDLCWKKVEGGEATTYLWQLQEGDQLQIQGPLGHFTLKQPLPKKLIFISTGTGIAPFRAMIYQLLHEKADCEIWNVFGNRYEEDILYREEFEKAAEEHSNFHNIFTVSRPKSPEWKGETDYVQHQLKKHFEADENTHIYICGLSAMINEVEKIAIEMGFKKEQIYYEKYD